MPMIGASRVAKVTGDIQQPEDTDTKLPQGQRRNESGSGVPKRQEGRESEPEYDGAAPTLLALTKFALAKAASAFLTPCQKQNRKLHLPLPTTELLFGMSARAALFSWTGSG